VSLCSQHHRRSFPAQLEHSRSRCKRCDRCTDRCSGARGAPGSFYDLRTSHRRPTESQHASRPVGIRSEPPRACGRVTANADSQRPRGANSLFWPANRFSSGTQTRGVAAGMCGLAGTVVPCLRLSCRATCRMHACVLPEELTPAVGLVRRSSGRYGRRAGSPRSGPAEIITRRVSRPGTARLRSPTATSRSCTPISGGRASSPGGRPATDGLLHASAPLPFRSGNTRHPSTNGLLHRIVFIRIQGGEQPSVWGRRVLRALGLSFDSPPVVGEGNGRRTGPGEGREYVDREMDCIAPSLWTVQKGTTGPAPAL
jgi:hypothetical protein